MSPIRKRNSEVLEEDSTSHNGTDQGNLDGTLGEGEHQQPGMVAVPSEGSIGSTDSQRDFVSMAKFAEADVPNYKVLVQEIEEMGNIFFRYFTGKDCITTRRYLSDVFVYRREGDVPVILGILNSYGESRRTGMFGYSVEPKHIHIIHDCTFGGSWCRDIFRNQIKPFGYFMPARRQNKPIWKFTRTDFYDVFVYFFLRKRGTRQIWVRGENWEAPTDGKSKQCSYKTNVLNDTVRLTAQLVRWEEEYRIGRQMVRIEDSWIDDERIGQGVYSNGGGADNSSLDEIHGPKPKRARKFTTIKQKAKILLSKYHISPLAAVKDMPDFRDDDELSDPKSKDYIVGAFEDFGRDINDKSLRELYEMISANDNTPKFMYSMQYGTLAESVTWIDDLLKYQFNDDDELICKFLNSIVDVIDKKIPKLNTIILHGPPSSGKNFFFDMVLAICLNYGQLGQANKNNLFAFQEAPNKRVLLWNEPNYESVLTDTIKMMLGGDPYVVRVKNQGDAFVRRTPVIVLTNNVVGFMVELAFKDRVVKYNWKAAPMLKDIDVKPYPMAFFEILNKYNISF